MTDLRKAEPPPEWPLIKNILAVFGLDAIAFVAEWKAAQKAEPTCPDCKAAVLYECVACSSNNYPPKQQAEPVGFYVYKPTLPRGNLGGVSDGDLPWVYDQDPSSGYAARMFVYTAPPQRQWVELTDVDVKNLELTSATSSDVRNILAELKEKNT